MNEEVNADDFMDNMKKQMEAVNILADLKSHYHIEEI